MRLSCRVLVLSCPLSLGERAGVRALGLQLSYPQLLMPYPNEPTYPTQRAMDNSAKLRADTTPPEQVLWAHLKNRRLGSFKFRRQHPIGSFVADFYCDEVKLVVELDSSYHSGRQKQDAERDDWMNSQSIAVLRVTASQLAKNKDGVLSEILLTAQDLLQDREMEKR